MSNENVQTINALTAENKAFYVRTLLKRALPNLLFYKFAQKKPMPKHEGDNVNFRKFNSLAPAITPLAEGVTPDGNSLSVSTVTATVKQYGDYITLSDKIQTTGIDPVVTEAVELEGEQGGLSIDTIIRNAVCNGTNVQYAGGKTSTEAITSSNVMSADEAKKAARTLKKANIQPFEGKYYVGFIDASQSYDIQNDALWQDVSKYSGGTAIMDGEIGKIGKIRFIETENLLVKKGAPISYFQTSDTAYKEGKIYYTKSGETYTKADITSFASGTTYYEAENREIHCAYIFGKDAYGVVDIEGKTSKPEIIIKPLGSGNDPLNQRSTVGWKALFTAVRLNELAMVRLETAVSE